jgi:hypothetical protein
MNELLTPAGAQLGRWTAWAAYWWFQGLIFTGIWVIGHEVSYSYCSGRSGVTEDSQSAGTAPSQKSNLSMM